jgi:branched-subunit amino acid aminotransferase/4-amino-4-deoxychorismate lyase
MDSIAIINGKEQSDISIFNRNFQYGDGLFETCIVKDNRILFWEKHLSRLEIGCRKLEVFISNSIIGIQSVNLIEDFQFQKRSLTERIKIAFESVTQDSKSWTCI